MSLSLIVRDSIKVAREAIVDSDEDISADRLKNAAATKKLAIFDAFEILNRIHEEEAMLEGKPIEEKKTAFKGFAEGRSKKWDYGYNKENNIVVISKAGQIGDILEIQGFQIAIPKQPKDIYSYSKIKEEQKWKRFEPNPDFKNIKTVFDWETYL